MMQQVTIGKDPSNQIVFTHDSVSRCHLQVSWNEQQEMMIEEPEPTTWGTYIDGRRIKKARLRPGQKVLIGTMAIHSEKLMEQIWKHAKTDRDFSAAFQKYILPHVLQYERKLKSWKLLEEYLPFISALIFMFAGKSINSVGANSAITLCVVLLFAAIWFLRSYIKDYFDRQKDRLLKTYSDKIICPNCTNSLILQDAKAIKKVGNCRVCEVKLTEK